jgi:two-component system, response regulator PdtaR
MSDNTVHHTILVVEDEPLVRMDAVSMLEGSGYDVVEAADAEQALTQLESRADVDTLFTDINMPGRMDGCALAYAVIALRPDMRLFITSGACMPDNGVCPAESTFVPKPYTAEGLLRTLRQARP